MFSPPTIVELINAFMFNTHAALEQVAMRFGLIGTLGGGGVVPRETRLMQHIVENPDLVGPGGGPLVLELAEYLFQQTCSEDADSPPEERFPVLVNALRQDGYVIADLRLIAELPDEVPLPEIRDELTRLLETEGFDTARGHFQQAIAAHARGDWAAANGQLRSFVEDMFDQIAGILSQGAADALPTSHARREWLATCNPPFFLTDLNEWDLQDHRGFTEGFWRRLHPAGAHPGLSDEADATFRLHLVILIAQHYMVRFDRMR